MIRKQTRDQLTKQALQEIEFARTYKQGAVWRWQRNEDLYYARKLAVAKLDAQYATVRPEPESRANVELGKMQSFVHSLLAKIDSPLTFQFKKAKMADLTRVELLNALREQDADSGDWNMKDLMGKKQSILYGRAIYSYHADSYDGYCSYLENVDVYDFLIDPSGGGLDLDLAMYLGRYGVRKNKQQLKEGVKAGYYIKTEAERLINGSGNVQNQDNQEEINKENRYSYIGSPANRTITDTNVYKFWEWYTTYEGERYYLLMTEGGIAVRVEKLKDIFKEDKKLKDANWPFWSWASFPDLTEFWTPSDCDYVREIFMAQSVNINQMLDNAERINKPQRIVDTSAIESLSDLIYRRNGVIRLKPGKDSNASFRIVETPSISTPLDVYDKLDQIQQLESGITAAAKGDAEEDKVGIYEGNQQNAADKFGLRNKSYTHGYKRFAKLWKNGVDQHLVKKQALSILGPDGYEETVWVSRRDMKPSEDYGILIESSNAEAQSDAIDKKNKLTFLSANAQNPAQNQKEAYEISATIAGFDTDMVRRLMDTSEFGEAKQISEADRDIEDLINNKMIEPNENANVAYGKRIVSYMKDHREDMTDDIFENFTRYMVELEPVIVRNMSTSLMERGAGPTDGAAQDTSAIQPEVMGQDEQQLTTNEPGQLPEYTA